MVKIKKEPVKIIKLVVSLLFMLLSVLGLIFTVNFYFEWLGYKQSTDQWMEDRMSVTNITNFKDVVEAEAEMSTVATNYYVCNFLIVIIIILELILLLLSTNMVLKYFKK